MPLRRGRQTSGPQDCWAGITPAGHFAILDRFAEAGLNAIDTADVYSSWVPGNQGGESETIIGKWMKSRGNRNRMVIITKVGSDMGAGRKGLGAKYIEQAADASLRRLGVDAIDLYLSHWPDPATPYEETLGAYRQLLKKGKVRAVGASNLDAGQMRAALDVARAHNLPCYDVLQPEYNLYDRSGFEGALRDLCVAEGIGVITYFSLAKGFLTGKYRKQADLGQSPRGEDASAYLNPGACAFLMRSTALHGGTMRGPPKWPLPGSWPSLASPRRSHRPHRLNRCNPLSAPQAWICPPPIWHCLTRPALDAYTSPRSVLTAGRDLNCFEYKALIDCARAGMPSAATGLLKT